MKSCNFVALFLALATLSTSATDHQTFPEFVERNGRTYTGHEYAMRQRLFEANLVKIDTHNRKSHRLWTAGITHLSDRKEDEVAALWGWNPKARSDSRGSGAIASTDLMVRRTGADPLPESFNWTHLASVKNILDQGQCGSCWAVAATHVLRAHSEIYGDGRLFSPQQIVSCTPNPHKCGGAGGCEGATAELAMDYVLENGLVDESDFAYTELGMMPETPECPSKMKPRKGSRIGAKDSKTSAYHGGNNIGMLGWERLPENKLEPLMRALVEKGPIAVSVAASESWSFYENGIMDDCVKNAVVNHAVTLIGYGSDGENKFWLIQNSWGVGWGEKGHMRILRRDSEEGNEEDFCGWDHQPEVGNACEGGPSKVWVCGTCGMLFDTVVPHFKDKSVDKALSGSLRAAHRNVQRHA